MRQHFSEYTRILCKLHARCEKPVAQWSEQDRCKAVAAVQTDSFEEWCEYLGLAPQAPAAISEPLPQTQDEIDRHNAEALAELGLKPKA